MSIRSRNTRKANPPAQDAADPGGLAEGARVSPKGKLLPEIPFDIEIGHVCITCDGDPRSVLLSSEQKGSTVEHQIDLSIDEALKLGAKLFTLPAVAELMPHLRLPEGVRELGTSKDNQARSDQSQKLRDYQREYTAQFGTGVPDGKQGIIMALTFHKEELKWGDVTVKYGRRDSGLSDRVLIDAPGPVSLFLLVDICASLWADIHTNKDFPHYSAPYMRRWGENSFEGTDLKEGMPLVLDRGVELVEEEDEFDLFAPVSDTEPEESQVPAAQEPEVTVDRPTPSPDDNGDTHVVGSLPAESTLPPVDRGALSKLENLLQESRAKVTARDEQILRLRKQLADFERATAERIEQGISEQISDERARLLADIEERRLQVETERKKLEKDRQQVEKELATVSEEGELVLRRLELLSDLEARIGKVIAQRVIRSDGEPRVPKER